MDTILKSSKINNAGAIQFFVGKPFDASEKDYSKYELGKTLILTSFIIDFAKHYNVSIDFICGKTKELNIKIKI